jgi:hypothetical protein
MDLRFTYDTYQDVRRNLFLYSVPFLIVAGFFTYFCILPLSHQQVIRQLIEYISNTQPWKGALGTTFGVVLFVGVAFILTELLQVHDQWYDKYVIKWRHQYATDVILPKLVQPFACALNWRFYEIAEGELRDFEERLFYPFVRDRDTKIPKNTLVRFYEVVTVYWLTQINEIILLALLSLLIVYRFVGPAELGYRTRLLNDFLILVAAILVNRLWIRASLLKVRKATEDEIRAIHDDSDLRDELKGQLSDVCKDYLIPCDSSLLNSL